MQRLHTAHMSEKITQKLENRSLFCNVIGLLNIDNNLTPLPHMALSFKIAA